MLTNEEKMLLSTLEEWWILTEYNENTEDAIDYYLNEHRCEVSDIAYKYDHAEEKLTKLEIVRIIRRSINKEHYDELIEDDDVLLNGEMKYNADTSAEFFTYDDCYLVWFKYAE